MSDSTISTQSPAGFQAAGVHARLKKDGALDMALIASGVPCRAAGVFTRNQMKAAPVLLDMERLAAARDGYRAVVVNTRCANACTGERGLADARQMARLTAQQLGCGEEAVLVLSTGVIGSFLPMEKIAVGIHLAAEALGQDWEAAARGIMTTDTRPKFASTSQTTAEGKTYRISGISKGAGMIAPNMATMLGVVVTDADISAERLDAALKHAADRTFNRIVIDGDMSTNDTLLLLANGASSASIDEAEYPTFVSALEEVCRMLAQAIVRDGEGVTKFITLNVSGAESDAAAHQIANTIATSPLVKTAFYGNDANWGRIVAAAGRAGVPIRPEETRLWLTPGEHYIRTPDSLLIFEGGMAAAYSEEHATAIVSSPEVSVHLEVGQGAGQAVVWTCDLSHDYVSINGDYRS